MITKIEPLYDNYSELIYGMINDPSGDSFSNSDYYLAKAIIGNGCLLNYSNPNVCSVQLHNVKDLRQLETTTQFFKNYALLLEHLFSPEFLKTYFQVNDYYLSRCPDLGLTRKEKSSGMSVLKAFANRSNDKKIFPCSVSVEDLNGNTLDCNLVWSPKLLTLPNGSIRIDSNAGRVFAYPFTFDPQFVTGDYLMTELFSLFESVGKLSTFNQIAADYYDIDDEDDNTLISLERIFSDFSLNIISQNDSDYTFGNLLNALGLHFGWGPMLHLEDDYIWPEIGLILRVNTMVDSYGQEYVSNFLCPIFTGV